MSGKMLWPRHANEMKLKTAKVQYKIHADIAIPFPLRQSRNCTIKSRQ